MGGFILGSSVALVLLQATLLLIDRSQTSWSFGLIQKRNSAQAPALDMQRCLSSNTSSAAPAPRLPHCILWFHTAQQLDPVLTQWNPHLILLALACVHCIVTLYATRKTASSSAWSDHRAYSAGLYYVCVSKHWRLCIFLIHKHTGILFLVWVVIAFVVGFAQQHHTPNTLLESSTWISSLFLFAATLVFLYVQVCYYTAACAACAYLSDSPSTVSAESTRSCHL
jgi:hypothetical protein